MILEDKGTGFTSLEAYLEVPGRDVSDPNAETEKQRIIDRAALDPVLESLPAKYSAALILYIVLGYSCVEMGDMLGCSSDAVKMRLMRARELFRDRYTQSMGSPLIHRELPRDPRAVYVTETPGFNDTTNWAV